MLPTMAQGEARYGTGRGTLWHRERHAVSLCERTRTGRGTHSASDIGYFHTQADQVYVRVRRGIHSDSDIGWCMSLKGGRVSDREGCARNVT